jgi:integrase
LFGVQEPPQAIEDELTTKAREILLAAYARSTQRSRVASWKIFVRFCSTYGHDPRVPSEVVFIRFATFLFSRRYAVSTIFSYLAALPSFYAALGLSVSVSRLECPTLFLLRQGLRRLAPPSRGPRKGLSISKLRNFRKSLDLSDRRVLALWAAITVGFFSFLRASNLVPKLARSCDGILYLRRSDVKFSDGCAILKVRRSKTNQFGERKVRIPIPEIPGDEICPVFALRSLFRLVKCIPSLPAFSYGSFQWIHYADLLAGVKQVASVSGLDPSRFGTHSLRRGGATFAAECGVPAYYIKLQGDWSSDCYTRYIALSVEQRMTAPFLMKKGVRGSR